MSQYQILIIFLRCNETVLILHNFNSY